MTREVFPTNRFRSFGTAIRAHSPDDIDVEIGSVDETDSSLEITVYVSTETTDTIDYTLNVNDTGTGGSADRSGTLETTGSFPGDSNTHEVSFGLGDVSGGEVTAQITAPEEYVGSEAQDQVSWGESDSIEPDFEVTQCDVSDESDGSLTIDYSIAPNNDTGGTTNVEFRVDGETVGGEFHDVPARGEGYSKTIPPEDLPVGENMPVEVGVDGDFSECGSVTTEEDDPQDEPEDEPESEPEPDISLTCRGLSETEIRAGESTAVEYTVSNSGGVLAIVDVGVFVDGEQIDTEFHTLSEGEEEEAAVELTFDSPGERSVSLEVVEIET